MTVHITEWFGYDLLDQSQEARDARRDQACPFLNVACTKHLSDGSTSGVCSIQTARELSPVIICPNRLYAGQYAALQQIAETAFGTGHQILHPSQFHDVQHDGQFVVAFGKQYGRELRLPGRGGRGRFFVDWILARISAAGGLAEFVAVEVQAIDTTGTYRHQVNELRGGVTAVDSSPAGLNWENVNKRILPQLIYKGHVLQRERLCAKGMFFVCPSAVYHRIRSRLGNELLEYENLQPGSLTFVCYDIGDFQAGIRPLTMSGSFSTLVNQVALAFTSPTELPPAGAYEAAIRQEIDQL